MLDITAFTRTIAISDVNSQTPCTKICILLYYFNKVPQYNDPIGLLRQEENQNYVNADTLYQHYFKKP